MDISRHSIFLKLQDGIPETENLVDPMQFRVVEESWASGTFMAPGYTDFLHHVFRVSFALAYSVFDCLFYIS